MVSFFFFFFFSGCLANIFDSICISPMHSVTGATYRWPKCQLIEKKYVKTFSVNCVNGLLGLLLYLVF
jgi:hypothetical protein